MTLFEQFGRKLGLLSGPTRDLGRADTEQVIKQLVRMSVDRTKKDIETWRSAIEYAENISVPRRWELIMVFKDIERDAHLTSVVQTRKLKVLGQKWKMVDVLSGEYNEKATQLLSKRWFNQFIDYAMDSLFWGYTCLEFPVPKDRSFDFIQVLPHEHISPERGEVLKNPGDLSGLLINEKPWSDWLMLIGEPDNLGLYMKATPNVMLKRNAQISWSDFAEIFGMPLRTATTTSRDKGEIGRITAMLDQMGRAAYGVFPEGTEISYHDTKHSDAYQVYMEQINLHNRELSKLILGQTGTADEKSFAGTANVHLEIAREYMEADLTFVKDTVNDKLLPFLERHGFGLKNVRLEWDREETLSSKDKVEIISKLVMTGYRPTQAELEAAFGWELEPTNPASNPLSVDPQAKEVNNRIKALYKANV